MENTSGYLQKEVAEVERKINEAKEVMMQELAVNLFSENFGEYQSEREKEMIEKEIREIEEEEYEDSQEEEDEDK